jgi:hypothetical protein
MDIRKRYVGKGIHLQIAPGILHRIQLRRIRWKMICHDTMSALEIRLDLFAPMRLEEIPHQDDRSTGLSPELPQETDDHLAGDIAFAEYVEKQLNASHRGAETQSCDDRDLPLASRTMDQDGSLAQRRPGPTNQGSHHEPCFIDEDEVCSKAFRFFLPGPTCP